MISGLLGKKVGMTHYFSDEAELVPVSVLELGPCVVTQVKTVASDGYDAIQVGFGRAKQINKPKRGHLKDNGDLRHLREFHATDMTSHKVGERLDVTEFRPGEYVDVTGASKGRGFQGVVKRHGYAGGPKTHGQGDRQRAPGSIGAGTTPGRVLKGKAMPGRMGGKRVTVQALRVERIDVERNLLLIRGAVPGAPNSLLSVRHVELDEAKLPPKFDPGSPLENQAVEPVDVTDASVEEAAVVVETTGEEVPAVEAEASVQDSTSDTEETPTAEDEAPGQGGEPNAQEVNEGEPGDDEKEEHRP